ncbi:hypothetical protein RB598_009176 [Gaeumannomyces tritici]
MKVKALSRAPQQPAGSDVARKPKNVDPALHPFERAREYQRALNAVKLERMFAAPFICQLGKGHVDSVFSMTMDPGSLSRVASGSADGVVKIWDLTSREEAWHTTAHENIVKDLCFTKDKKLLTCAADRTIKLFSPEQAPNSAPLSTWLGTNAFTSLSHHRSRNSFAASSSVISVYDLERHSAAPEVLRWPTSTDTINSVAFNQVEQSILGSCASDRGIVLYDLRTSMPLHKTVLNFTSNKIAWNPTEAFNFAVASEDHNIYIFDMRKIDRALNVLKGHVAAVMDVQFSPNGEELVSGSYDRTIRLWKKDKGHSVDIYHSNQENAESFFRHMDSGQQIRAQRLRRRQYPPLESQGLEEGRYQVGKTATGGGIQRGTQRAVRPHARDPTHQEPPPHSQGGQEGSRDQGRGAQGDQAEGGERAEALKKEVRKAEGRERKDDIGKGEMSRRVLGQVHEARNAWFSSALSYRCYCIAWRFVVSLAVQGLVG